MPTIYDVARRARVSTYTVSAVLNRSAYVSPELTERVHAAARELDHTLNWTAGSPLASAMSWALRRLVAGPCRDL